MIQTCTSFACKLPESIMFLMRNKFGIIKNTKSQTYANPQYIWVKMFICLFLYNKLFYNQFLYVYLKLFWVKLRPSKTKLLLIWWQTSKTYYLSSVVLTAKHKIKTYNQFQNINIKLLIFFYKTIKKYWIKLNII